MFDVTLMGALLAGLLSFLSPCILPIVPFYLSYLGGIGVSQLADGQEATADVRARAVGAACCFALGVITIFVGLGASATLFGALVREYFDVLRFVAAGVIVAMGLHFLGALRIGLLSRQLRAEPGEGVTQGFVGAYVVGLAFAFGWTPCVGPVLAAVLFTAAGQDSAGRGALLLMSYGVGITLPFVAAAVFIDRFMAWMRRFRRHLGTVEKLTGASLILFGLLIATNSVNAIAQWMIETVPWFANIG